MPDFMTVMRSNPGAIAQAGAALQTARQGFAATGTAFEAATETALATWKGKASTAARKVAGRFNDGVTRMSTHIGEAGSAASHGAGRMQMLATALRSSVMSAQSAGFAVYSIGLVFPGQQHVQQAISAGPAGPGILQAYMAVARMWTMYLNRLVRIITMQDQVTARQIQGIQLQLDSAIPFRSSIRAAPWFSPERGTLANNRRRGEVANQLNALVHQLAGRRELGAETPVHRRAGAPDYMRADRLTADSLGGDRLFDEVKAGGSRPSPDQQDILPRIRYGGPEIRAHGVPGLPYGTVLAPGQATARVQRWDVDSLPSSVREYLYRNPTRTVQDVYGGQAGSQARDDLISWMSSPASRVEEVL